jgi:hypothetical protein
VFIGRPKKCSAYDIIPVLLVNSRIIPQTTTSEIKCGIYVTVCTTLLNIRPLSSLSMRARIMGAGKPKIIDVTLTINVFERTLVKYGPVKKSKKLLKPTHGLPRIPIPGLKFLNAIITPYIGP